MGGLMSCDTVPGSPGGDASEETTAMVWDLTRDDRACRTGQSVHKIADESGPCTWALVGRIASRAAVLVLIGVFAASFFWDLTLDDAFITFRQAERLARGMVSYNDYPRVEASSSLAHTFLLAVLHKAGLRTELAARLLGLLALVVTSAALAWHAIVASPEEPRGRTAWGSWVALAPHAVILSSVSVSLWWCYGLETGLWTAVLVVLAVALPAWCREGRRGARSVVIATIAFGVMVRPKALSSWAHGWGHWHSQDSWRAATSCYC